MGKGSLTFSFQEPSEGLDFKLGSVALFNKSRKSRGRTSMFDLGRGVFVDGIFVEERDITGPKPKINTIPFHTIWATTFRSNPGATR
jgi:hypothetical protein